MIILGKPNLFVVFFKYLLEANVYFPDLIIKVLLQLTRQAGLNPPIFYKIQLTGEHPTHRRHLGNQIA